MMLRDRSRTAEAPLPTAVAFAVAAAALFLTPVEAAAQQRSNAQAEQSRELRARGPAARSSPRSGLYSTDTGERFVLDLSGSRPLLRFERRDETWVLRPTPAPRGDVIYRNDAGQQVLRVTPDGGMTAFSVRAPGGSPASLEGPAPSLAPPSLGPVQLYQLMMRRSAMLSQAMGRLIEINIDTGQDGEALTVEALIVCTDSVLRIARSPTARASLDQLRRITIVEGSRSSVSYTRGELRLVVAPDQGVAGRPSSARIIRAVLPQG